MQPDTLLISDKVTVTFEKLPEGKILSKSSRWKNARRSPLTRCLKIIWDGWVQIVP